MSADKKIDPENEIFVRREDFDRYFSKPIPKATFFRWVKDGKVIKARDLDGWYRLNATLVHQGFDPVDVKPLREKRRGVDRGLKNRQLLYLATLDASAEELPELLDAFKEVTADGAPDYLRFPEVLLESEIEKIGVMRDRIINSSRFAERYAVGKTIFEHAYKTAIRDLDFMDSLGDE